MINNENHNFLCYYCALLFYIVLLLLLFLLTVGVIVTFFIIVFSFSYFLTVALLNRLESLTPLALNPSSLQLSSGAIHELLGQAD